MDHGPEKSWLDFRSDPGHILDVMGIISLPVSQQYITIQDATMSNDTAAFTFISNYTSK